MFLTADRRSRAGAVLRLVSWILAAAAVLAILSFGAWLAAGYQQQKRADDLLTQANAHVREADRALIEAGIADAGPESGFTSVENINRGAELARGALAALELEYAEIEAAAFDVRAARRLAFIPGWYRNYLAKKEEVAAIRLRQNKALTQIFVSVNQLYLAGEVIFTAMEEMDRLVGRLEAAQALIRDDPEGSKAELEQISAAMAAVKARIESMQQQTELELLSELAASVAETATMVELTASLAEATASGDTAAIQSASIDLENRMILSDPGSSYLEDWWQDTIAPLQAQYEGLQLPQEQADAEAASIYIAGRR